MILGRLVAAFAALFLAATVCRAQTLDPNNVGSIARLKSASATPVVGAILFVHGYRGDAVETFKSWVETINQDRASPKAFLDPSLTDTTSLAQYDLFAVTHGTAHANLSIDRIIDQFYLQLTGNNPFLDHKHIVIVAHSAGGLIARELLIRLTIAASSSKNTPIERQIARQFLDKIHYLFLASPPLLGSPLAKVASRLPFSNKVLLDLSSEDGNRWLTRHHDEWRTHNPLSSLTVNGEVRKLPRITCTTELLATTSFFGKRADEWAKDRGWLDRLKDGAKDVVDLLTPGVTVVGPFTATVFGCETGDSTPLNHDHFSVVDIASTGHSAHILFRKQLAIARTFLDSPPDPAPTPPTPPAQVAVVAPKSPPPARTKEPAASAKPQPAPPVPAAPPPTPPTAPSISPAPTTPAAVKTPETSGGVGCHGERAIGDYGLPAEGIIEITGSRVRAISLRLSPAEASRIAGLGYYDVARQLRGLVKVYADQPVTSRTGSIGQIASGVGTLAQYMIETCKLRPRDISIVADEGLSSLLDLAALRKELSANLPQINMTVLSSEDVCKLLLKHVHRFGAPNRLPYASLVYLRTSSVVACTGRYQGTSVEMAAKTLLPFGVGGAVAAAQRTTGASFDSKFKTVLDDTIKPQLAKSMECLPDLRGRSQAFFVVGGPAYAAAMHSQAAQFSRDENGVHKSSFIALSRSDIDAVRRDRPSDRERLAETLGGSFTSDTLLAGTSMLAEILQRTGTSGRTDRRYSFPVIDTSWQQVALLQSIAGRGSVRDVKPASGTLIEYVSRAFGGC